jgi:hypothetical protein
VSVSGEFTTSDWNYMVAQAFADDPSGVSSVNIHVNYEWACLVGGRRGGFQETGEIDPFTAANGWGFYSNASCPDGGSWGIQGASIWAVATDTLGNTAQSATVRLP